MKPGRAADFERYWTFGTEMFVAERGSLGSRLLRQSEDVYFAIALWPERAKWTNERPLSPTHAAIQKKVSACLESSEVSVSGEVVVDRWVES